MQSMVAARQSTPKKDWASFSHRVATARHWYNPVRRHSSLGYRSPMAYEAAAVATEVAEAQA
jgi:transposase InsO family protein